MKKAILGFLTMVVFASLCFAQQNGSDGEKKDEGKTILKADTEFSVELLKAIDTEKAKKGDSFQLKTVEELNGIGKGSTIYGRVARVQKVSDGNSICELSLFFDFLKKGDEFLPINASVVLIGQETNEAKESDAENEVKFSPSPTYDGGTVISVKDKNLMLAEGTILKLKLNKDLKEPNE